MFENSAKYRPKGNGRRKKAACRGRKYAVIKEGVPLELRCRQEGTRNTMYKTDGKGGSRALGTFSNKTSINGEEGLNS